MTETQMATCPDCGGSSLLDALVNRGAAGCKWEKIPCITCKGKGEVSADWVARTEVARAKGKELREDRNRRDETLLDAARRLAMSVPDYSRLEHGVVES